jgi:predicted HTH transcriptional regulator
MFTAIELTRRTIRDTNTAANQCISAEQSSSRVVNRARVLRIIIANCKISERDLQRSANLKIDEVRAILEELVQMGQARYAGGGLIEAVKQPQPQRA